MRHIIITGMYRSGTTLVHHLLDSHDDLDVFPVENCIIRDSLFALKLPHSGQRSLGPLIRLIRAEKFDDVLTYIINHEKLGLALTENIRLTGSTGDQTVPLSFDLKIFKQEMLVRISNLSSLDTETLAIKLYEAYHRSYSAAIGSPVKVNLQFLVNKCPDAGLMIDCLLRGFDDAKVVHVIRAPRAVIASFKAGLDVSMYHRPSRLVPQLKLLRHSYGCINKYATDDRVLCIRYEDLVIDPKKVMTEVAKHIGISMSGTLVRPTISGAPWKSNSSNVTPQKSDYAISADLLKYRKKLNVREIKFIEDNLRDEMTSLNYPFDYSAGGRLLMVRYFLISSCHIPTYYFMIKRKLKKYLQKS